jgi:hemolysin activation/secretion protein
MRIKTTNKKQKLHSFIILICSCFLTNPVKAETAPVIIAQVPNNPDNIITPPQPIIPNSNNPKFEPLPPPEQLIPNNPNPTNSPEVNSAEVPGKITIKKFTFTGNTVFTEEQLQTVIKDYTNKPISFAELLLARSAITDFYVKNGYQTSGALIPPQTLTQGIVNIQIVEGKLEDIKVKGLKRLNPSYVKGRLGVATEGALNVPKLLEGLRLLQLDPLISSISAELSAGSRAGTSLLTVEVSEASTFSSTINFNNSRSPSVGSNRRGVQLREGNLLGLGDSVTIGYANTDASDAVDFNYTIPFNARNGTISFSYGNTESQVIEKPFDFLDINASSRYYDLTIKQPIEQTPSKEISLGLTLSRRETDTHYLEKLIGQRVGFPSPGADEEGRTRVTALRFFQEWTQRGSQEVIAARSQISVGLGGFKSTLNDTPPDGRFFSWRGQAQLVRLLAPDTLFLVRTDVQLADRTLLPVEQYGLGGQDTIRGYRQDNLLTDNGILFSTELRYPIARFGTGYLLQLVPFFDLGHAWNSSNNANPSTNVLASTGLGLQLNLGSRFNARFDWGVPLIDGDLKNKSWQENGLYFSVNYNPF